MGDAKFECEMRPPEEYAKVKITIILRQPVNKVSSKVDVRPEKIITSTILVTKPG